MFFECPATKERWEFFDHISWGTCFAKTPGAALLSRIEGALHAQRKNPALMILIVEILMASWKERNQKAFQQVTGWQPASVILEETKHQLQMLLYLSKSAKKTRQLNSAISDVCTLIRNATPSTVFR